MSSEFQRLFNIAEQHRQGMTHSLNGWSDERLNRQPEPGQWSPVQIVQHLYLAETGTLNYVKKKGQGIQQAKRTPWSMDMKMILLQLYLASPAKRKAPAYVEPAPDFMTLNLIVEPWNAVRQDLQAFFAAIPEPDLRKEIFRHPFVGMMNSYQAIQFMDWHVLHHERQLQRTLRHLI
jgi:hypothetical protein